MEIDYKTIKNQTLENVKHHYPMQFFDLHRIVVLSIF